MNKDYGDLLLQLAKRITKKDNSVTLEWSGISRTYGFRVSSYLRSGWI